MVVVDPPGSVIELDVRADLHRRFGDDAVGERCHDVRFRE